MPETSPDANARCAWTVIWMLREAVALAGAITP